MNAIKILDKTYFDVATIKRKVKVKDDTTGTTKLVEVVIYENMKCSISKVDNPSSISHDVQNVDYAHKIFSTPDNILLPGDKVEVKYANGLTDTYECGKPFYYSSHLEVKITLKERV